MADEQDSVSGELTIGGRTRMFLLRRPAGTDGVVPLLLVLHGNHPEASGAQMREWTRFDRQADRWGFAVAYPDGWGGCWADGRGVTTADEAGVDDVAFLTALINSSAERYRTHPDRAVIAGVSNGAFMAHRMGVDAGDRVAVLAAVAGGLPAGLQERSPDYAVSAMLIHGDADPISPLEGGFSRHLGPNGEQRGRTISLDETAAFWRAVDRCPPDPDEQRVTDLSRRLTSAPGIGGTQVVAWTVFGGGHSWPGSVPIPGYEALTSQEFDAAEEICRFAADRLAPAADRRLTPGGEALAIACGGVPGYPPALPALRAKRIIVVI